MSRIPVTRHGRREKVTVSITVCDLPSVQRSLLAAFDLLAAVEDAAPETVLWQVKDAAANLRRVVAQEASEPE